MKPLRTRRVNLPASSLGILPFGLSTGGGLPLSPEVPFLISFGFAGLLLLLSLVY